jgi:hypothetical protein
MCDYHKLQLNEYNIHRIILASLMLAIKMNEDDYYSNDYYAKVGGITLQEINKLEYECLKMLDHHLWVDLDFFEKYKVYLRYYVK